MGFELARQFIEGLLCLLALLQRLTVPIRKILDEGNALALKGLR